MAEDRVIGKNNALPWHIPADLQRFREITLGKPVIMGRRTFESIGQPLKGRTNIVVTRDPMFQPRGVRVTTNYDLALEIAVAELGPDDRQQGEVLVIGGEQIFELALAAVDRIYLTKIDASYDGDARFPEFDIADWRVTLEQALPKTQQSEPDAKFCVLERRECRALQAA